MRVRTASGEDGEAIGRLLERCFPGGSEASLVEALTAGGHAEIVLLADEGPSLAGASVLSRMAAPARCLGLGPVATDPALRGRGIARALVRQGLDRARVGGWRGVFVLGDPGFYGRFGFTAGLAARWRSPYAGPFFMALELSPGALAGGGRAEYAAPLRRALIRLAQRARARSRRVDIGWKATETWCSQ